MKRGWNQRPGEDGSALLETSLSAVMLVLLVLAIFEFGMVFAAYASVINASRVAASYASMHPDPTDEEYERYAELARHELRAARLAMDEIEVGEPQTPEGTEPGSPLSVTVTYRLTTFSSTMSFPMFGRLGLPDHYNIRWTAVVPIR